MSTWTVGSVRVTRIEEQLGFANMPPEKYLAGFDPDLVHRHRDWLVPDHYSPEHHRLVTSVHSWLIRTERLTVLVDCCAGNHKERPWTPRFHGLNTPFLERLREAGAAPESIDVVLCTHLHADHVGWNTVLRDGRWVPTFPNARYLYSKQESDYWDAARNPAMRDDPRAAVWADSVLPVVLAGQSHAVEGSHAINDALRILPAPGHTPGHVMLELEDRGERGVFCGDAIHHPLQVYAPHWNHMADEDPEAAARTRGWMLESCAERRSLLFPTHFGAPHVVRVEVAGSGFAAAFVPGHQTPGVR